MENNLKKNTYIYILKELNHFAIHLKVTQYCKTITSFPCSSVIDM